MLILMKNNSLHRNAQIKASKFNIDNKRLKHKSEILTKEKIYWCTVLERTACLCL